MSLDRGAVDADLPHAVESRRGNPGAFRVYTYTLLIVGTVAAAVMWWRMPVAWDGRLFWVLPALVVGFVLAEQLAINIDVRGGVSWTISFTEVPMVVGLLVAPFQAVLLAHVLAGVGTLLVRRVHDRAAYNAGVMLIEVDSAFLVAHLVNSALPGVSWAGAFAGALAVPLTSTLFAVFAVRLLGQSMRLGSAVRLIGRVLVVGLLNSSVGVTAYELVRHSPWGWPLVMLVVTGLSGLYVAYNGLLREQRDLEVLSDVSLMVARSGQRTAAPAVSGDVAATVIDPAEWQVITERIKDQLGARRVVLRLWPDPRQDVRTLIAGDPLPGKLDHGGRDRSVRDDPMLRLAGAGVRQFRQSNATDEVLDALAMRGTHEALVVPLRGANQVLGVLEAHDRASRWRGFGRADVQLIGTLASHLATAVDNRRLLARLRHDAYHDPLTGLLNRAGFRETSTSLLRAHPDATVVRLDVDVLAAVSDALGYAWSDRMVVAAGRRLRELLGAEVPLARLESGTFATLLTDHTDETVELEANRLHSGLAAPYQVDRLSVEAGVTVGYVQARIEDDGAEPGVEPDVDELLRRSDMAVRAARGNGEHVRAYSPSMGQVFLRRFELVTQFRQALASGQVQVHYQPKVALPSRQVLGVEALVRWSHPEYGRLAPDEFVPAVEATGLIDALTSFVTECALTKVKDWQDRGIRMSAAVNLSVRNLDDQSFPDRVAEQLRRHDVPPELLTFELTESGVMSDPAKALPVLRRLHAMGVVLAVDDFGTGYSSLAYLRRLPVDEVKIDKSFVLGMGSDLGDLAVVRSIVELGHSLGLTVVAEGVEDDVARDALVTMGCHVAQGYLISRPLPEDRLEAWLSARTVSGPGMRNETVLTLVP
ncbi:MAG TPA: EAL domain-containing protein [Pseudonocardiaceae bacterium]|jgi:EAL domain-containing protein (putative c-di-GMP-specific phosphodiesterase class I)|nr:EAL domain-containing protein [Pseudonocardiaceae bacterium]